MARVELKDHLREQSRFTFRAIISGALVLLLLMILLVRLAYLQILNHEHYTTLSRDNRVKLQPLPPTRGLIYDRQGVVLAENLPAYSLEITPEKVQDPDSTLDRLAELIEISDSDRERFFRLKQQKRRFEGIPIRVQLSNEETARFAVEQHRFPGVEIRAHLKRAYPQGDYTAHALGYVGRISENDLEQIVASDYAGTSHIGKIGVEKTYEAALHGEVGMQKVEVNALGRNVRLLEQTPPSPGQSLRLHLDIRLQKAAIEALGENNGAAVAIDPNTGGVLALVSKPSFDPNLFVEGISSNDYDRLQHDPDKPLYNRALRGQYPPGSTLKPFIGLGGLELQQISTNSKQYCPGYYQLPGHEHKYRDWKKTGHGPMTIDDAITQSCDVYFYQLAHDLGIDKLSSYLAPFGFGKPTGIDLTGERPGILPSREWKKGRHRQVWYPGETLIMGIGQGYFLTTPLQLAAATAAFANGGTYYTPRIVSAIVGNNGETLSLAPLARPITIHDQANWDEIGKAMSHVVEGLRGTARLVRNDNYRIAGKTGTAQVFSVAQEEEYDEEKIAKKLRDHALFIAYAPIEAPRIAVAVIVENGGHGGSTAAPVAKKIMDAYLLGDDS